MIARVVKKRDDAELAIAVTVLSVLSLALVLADDLGGRSAFRPPSNGMYTFVALLIAFAGVAPWLAWSRRGRAVHVRFEDGIVVAGDTRIFAADVSALSVAQGARGQSVAVSCGNKTTFFEVERAEDTARIAEALGVNSPPLGASTPDDASRLLAIPQALLTIVSLVCAPLYYLAAAHSFLPASLVDAKTIFGLGGVVAAALAMLLLFARWLFPNQALALGRRGAWDGHVALHCTKGASEAAAPHVRIGTLERGEQGVGAWLARLDAIPSEQHAYRGDAMKKDVLWETLGDSTAAVDVRMGAARVLRKRYGEEEGALVRVVEDPDVRLRVEAALEDQEDAERALEMLGPLFRAR